MSKSLCSTKISKQTKQLILLHNQEIKSDKSNQFKHTLQFQDI